MSESAQFNPSWIVQVPLQGTGVLYKCGSPQKSEELDEQTTDMKTRKVSKMILLTEMNTTSQYQERGINAIHYPIPDSSIPNNKKEFKKLVTETLADLDGAKNVVLVDKYGQGRTGFFIACLAIEKFKQKPQEALDWINKHASSLKLSFKQQSYLAQFNTENEQWVALTESPNKPASSPGKKLSANQPAPVALSWGINRTQYLTHYLQNASILTTTNASTSSEQYIGILNAAGQCLIGLSLSLNFDVRTNKSFHGLEGYLGKKDFEFVPENIFTTTAKISKAAILYIIKGLNSTDPKVSAHAKKVVGHLVTDFLTSGQLDPQAEKMKSALLCLGIALYKTNPKTGLDEFKNLCNDAKLKVEITELYSTIFNQELK